jgi:hypothetical protein
MDDDRRGFWSVAGRIGLVLGILVSCITIYQALPTGLPKIGGLPGSSPPQVPSNFQTPTTGNRNGGNTPSTGSSGSSSTSEGLQITPTDFSVVRDTSTGGCTYFPNNYWNCLVDVKDTDTSNSLNYTTNTNPSTVTVFPSTSNIALSPGETREVFIKIPDQSCPAQATITFSVPGGGSVDVHWNCAVQVQSFLSIVA